MRFAGEAGARICRGPFQERTANGVVMDTLLGELDEAIVNHKAIELSQLAACAGIIRQLLALLCWEKASASLV